MRSVLDLGCGTFSWQRLIENVESVDYICADIIPAVRPVTTGRRESTHTRAHAHKHARAHARVHTRARAHTHTVRSESSATRTLVA